MSNFHELELPKDSEIAMGLVRKILWSQMPHKSFISGLWLRTYENTPLWANCFLHVLPVDKYRYFKYYYKNFILCSPGEAGLWTQGSEEERIQYALSIEQNSRGTTSAEWNKVKDLETELIAEYKKHFPMTRGMVIGYNYSLQEQSQIIGRLNKKYLQEMSGRTGS